MRRLEGGERERHLRAMEDATSSPGRTRAASPATRSRPGPTTVKGTKAKMPRWRAERREVHRKCTSSSGVIRTNSPGVIRALRLVGAPTPSPEGEAKRQECG